MKVNDRDAFAAAKEAYAKAESNPVMVKCSYCKGKGYHHGFGEDGADPDWCSSCGGGGVELAAGEEDRPLRSAVRVYLAALSQASERQP